MKPFTIRFISAKLLNCFNSYFRTFKKPNDCQDDFYQIKHNRDGYGEGNGNPLQYSCLENPTDGGAWWAAVYGVAQSRTQLK